MAPSRWNGCFPLSFSLDHVGALTRTVEDSAIVTGALVRPQIAEKMGYSPAKDSPFPGMRDGVGGLGIGVIEEFHSGTDARPARS